MGANWKTTLWGSISAIGAFITALCVAISQAATDPGHVDPFVQMLLDVLPQSIRFYVMLIAGLITSIALQRFGVAAKSKDVTGGTVQQDLSGKEIPPGNSRSLVRTTAADTASVKPSNS